MSELVLCKTRDAVTTITLNREDVGNLVSNEMGAEIAAMLDAARESKLIVLRGAGPNFCLGRDQNPPSGNASLTALDVRRNNTDPALALYAAFRRVPVPILGVVTGGAIGIGCALAGLCDVTYAAEDSRFQLPEMTHDIPPCLAMSALIDRVPRKAVMHLVYSTDPITAAEALAIGLVSKVVPPVFLEAEVDRFIGNVSSRHGSSVRAVKEYMRSAPSMDPQGAADFATNLLSNVLSSRR